MKSLFHPSSHLTEGPRVIHSEPPGEETAWWQVAVLIQGLRQMTDPASAAFPGALGRLSDGCARESRGPGRLWMRPPRPNPALTFLERLYLFPVLLQAFAPARPYLLTSCWQVVPGGELWAFADRDGWINYPHWTGTCNCWLLGTHSSHCDLTWNTMMEDKLPFRFKTATWVIFNSFIRPYLMSEKGN